MIVQHQEKHKTNGHHATHNNEGIRLAWRDTYVMGYNILPCKGKKPLAKWKKLQTERLDVPTLREWLGRLRPNNFCILLGRKPYPSQSPALVVVDADTLEGLQAIEATLPPTPLWTKTRKGKHLLYRRPDIEHVGNRAIILNGKKVGDVKADGGYCMAPGSIHPDDGSLYEPNTEWTIDLLNSLPVYDPAWFDAPPFDKVAESDTGEYQEGDEATTVDDDEYTSQARTWIMGRHGATADGKAGGYCLQLARTLMAGFRLKEETAINLLYEWGQKPDNQWPDGSYYPWSRADIAHKVHEAIKTISRYEGAAGDMLDHTTHVEKIITPLDEQDWSQADPMDDERPSHDKGDKPTPTSGYKFKPLTSAEFDQQVYKQEWLIKKVLVKGQATIIGGPKKSLKTNLLTDMAISLGSGSPFLGQFSVRKCRVTFISGESGRETIQETARRICKAKGIKLSDCDVLWDFRLPRLSIDDEVAELAAGLAHHKSDVIIIDPLYLCLLSGGTDKNAANLFDMGPLLLTISNACLQVGCTPLLAHHARKNLNIPHQPLELEDLAFAGVQEFARQWLLINRRASYVPDSGHHELWMSSGGSVGHGGLWALDVAEGQLSDDFTGRKWDVKVMNLDEAKEVANAKKVYAKQTGEEQLEVEFLQALDSCKEPPTKSALGTLLAWGEPKRNRILTRLINAEVVRLQLVKGKIGKGATREMDVIVRV